MLWDTYILPVTSIVELTDGDIQEREPLFATSEVELIATDGTYNSEIQAVVTPRTISGVTGVSAVDVNKATYAITTDYNNRQRWATGQGQEIRWAGDSTSKWELFNLINGEIWQTNVVPLATWHPPTGAWPNNGSLGSTPPTLT